MARPSSRVFQKGLWKEVLIIILGLLVVTLIGSRIAMELTIKHSSEDKYLDNFEPPLPFDSEISFEE
jgi:uncharacterized membrane protein